MKLVERSAAQLSVKLCVLSVSVLNEAVREVNNLQSFILSLFG